MNPATQEDLDNLNAAQIAFNSYDGSGNPKEIVQKLEKLRPRGYIATHGDGQCRVFLGDDCLTPLYAISEEDAVQLCLKNKIQLKLRFSLTNYKWSYHE